jgi:hypothetical protein
MTLKVDRRKRPGDRHRPGYYRDRRSRRPFVAVDGEGWGSTYALLADSGGHSIHDYDGLPTRTIFDWLSRLRERNGPAHFVGFALNYDINHWLRDLPSRTLYRLWRVGHVRWEEWFIEWTPGKWFHLKHLPSERSVRVWDSFGFFQGSFLKACADWGVEVPSEVKEGKAGRSQFTSKDLPRIMAYNEAELRCLVVLMDRLRAGLEAAGIPGTQWYGAGAAATRLFQLNRVKETISLPPSEVQEAALGAYFGGRIEAGKFGRIEGPIWNGDLNSAYPSAMAIIPNLSQGKWRRTTALSSAMGVYLVEWDWPEGSPYYPLPWRDEDGSIYFPRVGRSWIWWPEVRACELTGWKLKILDGWVWESGEVAPKVEWKDNLLEIDWGNPWPYLFLFERYNDRLKVGKKTGAGLAIKLAINAAYGKTAQREGYFGRPTYRQFEIAGWVTSFIRARLWTHASRDLNSVVSFNTDGIFALKPLANTHPSENFGTFSSSTYRRMEVAEPGVYRLEREDGTWEYYGRGFGKKGVPWDEWSRARARGRSHVTVQVTRFHGLGECLHRDRQGRVWLDRKKWRTWETVEKRLAVLNPSKKRLGDRPYNPTFGVPVMSAPHDPGREEPESDRSRPSFEESIVT